MTVDALPTTGNSSKFRVTTKRGEFTVALSFTLRSKIWKLSNAEAELATAQELAEAIVSRHDPSVPFNKIYIFAEHTAEDSPEATIKRIRKYGYNK